MNQRWAHVLLAGLQVEREDHFGQISKISPWIKFSGVDDTLDEALDHAINLWQIHKNISECWIFPVDKIQEKKTLTNVDELIRLKWLKGFF